MREFIYYYVFGLKCEFTHFFPDWSLYLYSIRYIDNTFMVLEGFFSDSYQRRIFEQRDIYHTIIKFTVVLHTDNFILPGALTFYFLLRAIQLRYITNKCLRVYPNLFATWQHPRQLQHKKKKTCYLQKYLITLYSVDASFANKDIYLWLSMNYYYYVWEIL